MFSWLWPRKEKKETEVQCLVTVFKGEQPVTRVISEGDEFRVRDESGKVLLEIRCRKADKEKRAR